MNHLEREHLISLCRKEGWEIIENPNARRDQSPYSVNANGSIFPIAHPFQIHLTLYRRSTDPDQKFLHMKAAHDYLWPDFVYSWNDWDERRFRAHCGDHKYIVLAGGASCAKSHCVARIACLFWLSDTRNNACIIASTTLEALESRIWGYAAKFINEAALPIEAKILTGKPPKVLPPGAVDRIHGMFAVAVRSGESGAVLSSIIGRHPNKRLMIVLDEATDMNAVIVDALPNLERGVELFQCWAIGNSSSKSDLHGALATPRHAKGWESLDPMRDYVWETTYDKGICLYFNPYDSPAIKDPDPVKRAILSKFLITKEIIESEKADRGEDSEGFWRFVMGFWKGKGIEGTVASEPFLLEHYVHRQAEWTGFYPLDVVAGLDPAFSVGGTGCLLRLAILGHTSDGGRMALDFRGEELVFRIEINVTHEKSGELQLAENVVKILRKYNCPVRAVCMDATGPGRALGELIRLVSGESQGPIKIISNNTSKGMAQKKNDPDVIVVTPSEMWFKFKEFVQHRQVKGLDLATVAQFTSRLLIMKNGKMSLESKPEYKHRMVAINPKLAKSPDEADSAVLALHSAIINYGFRPGQTRDSGRSQVADFFEEKMRAFQNEKLERLPDMFNTIPVNRRPKLVPNFSASLEDSIRKRS